VYFDTILLYLDYVLSRRIEAIPLIDRQHQRASRIFGFSQKRVEALNGSMDAHQSEAGLIEARGTNDFTRGSACTDWKSWKRIEFSQVFPDAVLVEKYHYLFAWGVRTCFRMRRFF